MLQYDDDDDVNDDQYKSKLNGRSSSQSSRKYNIDSDEDDDIAQVESKVIVRKSTNSRRSVSGLRTSGEGPLGSSIGSTTTAGEETKQFSRPSQSAVSRSRDWDDKASTSATERNRDRDRDRDIEGSNFRGNNYRSSTLDSADEVDTRYSRESSFRASSKDNAPVGPGGRNGPPSSDNAEPIDYGTSMKSKSRLGTIEGEPIPANVNRKPGNGSRRNFDHPGSYEDDEEFRRNKSELEKSSLGSSSSWAKSPNKATAQSVEEAPNRESKWNVAKSADGLSGSMALLHRGYGTKEEFESAAATEGELARQSYEAFTTFMKEEEAKGRNISNLKLKDREKYSEEASVGADGDEPETSPQPFGGEEYSYNNMDAAYGMNEMSQANSRVSFTLRAHPRGLTTGMVQCLIIRDRTATYTNYELYLEAPFRKLILAMKMNMNRTSNYHFFDLTRGMASNAKLTKKSGNYLGKLRALNSHRTEYVLLTQNTEREEVAAVVFEPQRVVDVVTANSQPRKMTVVLPHIDSQKLPIPNKVRENSTGAAANSLIDIIKQNQLTNRALKFENKQPVFENGNYRLDFGGRVSKASVKNFQLVSSEEENGHIICQFGKIENDRYTLDYRAPLNAFQAFSLAVCQFNL